MKEELAKMRAKLAWKNNELKQAKAENARKNNKLKQKNNKLKQANDKLKMREHLPIIQSVYMKCGTRSLPGIQINTFIIPSVRGASYSETEIQEAQIETIANC